MILLLVLKTCTFNAILFFFFFKRLKYKRNVRLKIVVSGCDQCVWPVGVVAVCGHWVRH